MSSKQKNETYGWFIFFAMLFIIVIIALLSDNSVNSQVLEGGTDWYGDSFSLDEILIRDNESAENILLPPGKYIVGTDISPGRYHITADSIGSIFVYEKNRTILQETLDPDKVLGVSQITTDLTSNQVVELNSLQHTTFTPAIPGTNETLHTGHWLVGYDILPGKYIATGNGLGNLFIYDGYTLQVNEILSGEDNPTNLHKKLSVGLAQLEVELQPNQKIIISQLHDVTFSPMD